MESTFHRTLFQASVRSCRPSSSLRTAQCKHSLSRTHQQQRRTIRTIRKNVIPVSRFKTALGPLEASPPAALGRREAADTLPLRTGALAIKKGMSAMYDESGKRTPCTVLQMDRVQVVGHKTIKKHGYYAVCVGQGWRDPKNVYHAQLGQFASTTEKFNLGASGGISPKRDIREFRVKDKTGLLPVGSQIDAAWFREGQFIDARSNTKGHGFTGVRSA